MVPLFERLSQAGRTQSLNFATYAVALPKGQPGLNREPLYEAHMLILRDTAETVQAEPIIPVGASCRICAVAACAARREPSILAAAE